MLDSTAPSVPDKGFSVDSLIDKANAAWNEPDEPLSGTDDAPPLSPESPGVESSPSEPPSADILADRGDGRDTKGRFAPKEAKTEGPQDQVAEAPVESAAPSPTQAPKAEAPPENPPGELVSPASTAEPFSVRFGGRDFGIPGAVRTESHVVIPREQEDTISRYLGMGLKFESERETMRQEKAKLSVEREMFTAETGPVMEEVKRLFEIAALADDTQFAEEFSKYAWELRSALPLLRERMELSKKRQEFEIEKRMHAPDPETVAAQFASGAVDTAEGHLTSWKQDAQTKGLIDADWEWIRGRVKQDPHYFLNRAGQRLTPDEQESGVQPGEVYFNQDKLADLVNIRLDHRREVVSAIDAQKRAVAIAKENAVRQQAGSVPPPPSSGRADAAPVESEGGAARTYKSMDELKKALGVAW